MNTTSSLINRSLVASLVLGLPFSAFCQNETAPTPAKNGKQTGELHTGGSNAASNPGMAPTTTGSDKKESASQESSLSASDQKFIMKAAMGGMAEVKLGQLAEKNGSSTQVKEFGAMMVKDHSKANAQLMSVAKSKGVTLPSELDEKHQTKYEKMSQMKADDFDKAYIKDMVADHKTDVALFQAEAKKGDDAEVKSFATQTLPTLQMHLEHIEGLQK
jgi:putative membrane protein